MRLDPNPLFRRAMVPWYDRTPTCWLLLLFMVALIVFAAVGVSVALREPNYQAHVWVPSTLLVLCLFVCASLIRRLFNRYYNGTGTDKEL